ASWAGTGVRIRPPVSTIDAWPLAATASTSLVTSRAATALASSSPSRWMRICGVAMASFSPGRDVGDDRGREVGRQRVEGVAVDLVCVEPAQLLGQEVGGVPAVQRDVPVRLARPGQRGVPAVRPADGDVAVGGDEGDPG